MADDSIHSHVAAYIDAAVRTTTRSREILILIIIVSVLVFGAFWNARQGSWISERLAMLSAAYDLRTKEQEVANLPDSEESFRARLDLKNRRFEDAREFLDLRKATLGDADAIKKAKDKLEDIETEHVLYLKLPFFGLFMDVNDLGMLGGFTFVVLLLWLRSSLWHELQNLRIGFAEARRREHLRFAYEALSMQQVLTTPPPIEGDANVGHWSIVVRTLLLLPLLVHLTVFSYDGMSFQYGWSISPRNTIVGTTVSAVFLVLIAWLTYLCFILSARVNLMWQSTAQEIKAAPEERLAPKTT